MTTTLRLVDSDETTELLSANWFTPTILNSVDHGSPTIREVTTPVSGGNGERHTTKYVGARVITAVLTLPEGPAAEAADDALRGLMDPAKRNYVYIGKAGWTGERRAQVVANGYQCPPGVMRQAQCIWKAPSGLLEDATPTSVTLSPSGSASGGMSFPMSFPMSFNSGLVAGAALVDVGGNIAASPVIDIYGPCSDPLVRCVDTGDQIVFTGLSIADGDYLRVDMGARTAFLNSDPGQSRYDRVDFSQSDWWTLPPGTGVQVVFSPTSPSGGCKAVMVWHARWL